jgi:hypothetical protein
MHESLQGISNLSVAPENLDMIARFSFTVTVGSPPNTSTSARVCRVPVYSWMVSCSIRSYGGGDFENVQVCSRAALVPIRQA